MAKTTGIEQKKGKLLVYVIGAMVSLFGIWAIVIFTSHAFITPVKRLEYIIAVVFLGLYPLYYKVISKYFFREHVFSGRRSCGWRTNQSTLAAGMTDKENTA